MKIVFICGCLQLSYDGVGDYTYRLAGELINYGHQVIVIAINDTYIQTKSIRTQVFNRAALPIYRLPGKWPLRKRLLYTKRWINDFNPDWLSLQYVPYAYQKYGIPVWFSSKLKTINTNAKWHLMIHEPYLENAERSVKRISVKILQILALKLLYKCLKPNMVHTSIPHYKSLLDDISIDSRIMGLYGNIDRLETSSGGYSRGRKALMCVFFGSAPMLDSQHIFANKLKEYLHNNNVCLLLVICGKTGKRGKLFVSKIKETCASFPIEITEKGNISASEVSKLFAISDFGIARVPPRFLGKSGAAISMLEHGLPLWVPLGLDETIKDYLDFRPELCFHYLDNIPPKAEYYNRLPEVATKLVAELTE